RFGLGSPYRDRRHGKDHCAGRDRSQLRYRSAEIRAAKRLGPCLDSTTESADNGLPASLWRGAMTRLGCGLSLFVLMMGVAWADAQSLTNMAVLKGLAPVSALAGTPDGRAALASNFTVTGGIQTGVIRQSTLLPFAEQQQQALRDAFITDGNLTQLADGFGSTLGGAYQARAHYLDRERFTSV